MEPGAQTRPRTLRHHTIAMRQRFGIGSLILGAGNLGATFKDETGNVIALHVKCRVRHDDCPAVFDLHRNGRWFDHSQEFDPSVHNFMTWARVHAERR